MTSAMKTLTISLFALALGCGTASPGGPGGPTLNGRVTTPADDEPAIQSNDILARDAQAARVEVKHILIGWKDLGDAYQGHMDPRAAKRSRADADALAVELLERARKGEDFDALIKKYSEDPGSNKAADFYSVAADGKFVFEFKRLSLRLKVDEIGLVKSPFGWHVIRRYEPSADQNVPRG